MIYFKIKILFKGGKNMYKKVIIIIGISVFPLLAGIYEDSISVDQWIPQGGSWTVSRVWALTGVYIAPTTLPQPFGTYFDLWSIDNPPYPFTITHNITWNSNTPGDQWHYTSIFNGQLVDDSWVATLFNDNDGNGVRWWGWYIRMNYRPNCDIQQPFANSYHRLNTSIEILTNGTQYARIWLTNLSTSETFLLMPWTINPNDDQGWSPWDIYYTLNTTFYPDGYYKLRVEVVDNEGFRPLSGYGPTDTVVNFYIDNTPPTVGPYSPIQGEYLTGTVLLEVYANDNMALSNTNPVQYQVDGDSWNNMSYNPTTGRWEANLNTTLYIDGSHTITYRATDMAGNTATYDLNVYFDNTPPSADIVRPSQDAFLEGETVIQIQATDNLAIDRVLIDFGGVLSQLGTKEATYNSLTGYWEFTVNTPLYPDGRASITSTVYDKAGLSYTTPLRMFWVDNNLPTLQPINPQNGFYLTGTEILKIIATDGTGIPDNGNNPVYRIDNGVYKDMVRIGTTDSFSDTLNTLNYNDGLHSFEFSVHDSAGRRTTVSLNAYFDNTKPNVSIVSPTGGEYIFGTYVFKANGFDNLAVDKVTFTFGGVLGSLGTKVATYNPSTGYYEYVVETTQFPEGEANVYAIIIDKAGLSDTSSTVNFYVDNTLPHLQALKPISGTYITDTVDLKVLAWDETGLSGVYYQVDNGTFNSMTNVAGDTFIASLNTLNYQEGMHTITYKAVATTGTWDTTSITLYFDNTKPNVSIVLPEPYEYVKGVYTFSASAIDNMEIKNVEFVFSGVLSNIGRVAAQFNSATGYYEYVVNTAMFDDGDAGMVAEVYDNAGLRDSVYVSFHVDNTPPKLSIKIIGAKGDTIYPDSNYVIKLRASELLKELPSLSYYPVGFDSLIPLIVEGTPPDTVFTSSLRVDGSTGDALCRFVWQGKDLAGNIGNMISEGEWFYINCLSPILSHTPITVWNAFHDLPLSVASHGTRVAKIYLYYKSHFASDYKVKEFEGGNPYVVKIPGQEVVIDGIDYYIEAISEENLVTRIGSRENPIYVKVIAWIGNGENYDDNILHFAVPLNAISDTSKIGISRPFNIPSVPDSIPYTGIFFEIISHTSLNAPITLKITYPEEFVSGMNEDELNLVNAYNWKVHERDTVLPIENIYKTHFDGFEKDTNIYIFGEEYTTKAKELLPFEKVYFAPNPVKDEDGTTLFFYLNTVKKKLPKEVIIKIYDISGDLIEIKRIKNPMRGINKVWWNTRNIPRGIYIFNVSAGNESVTKKVGVIK
ncbi:MAG: Ig-like domain-containing protein [Candidatus Aenigmatarchaeota archaeon]